MERAYISFTLANFITIGLIAAIWYAVLVGGYQLYGSLNSSAAAAS